MFSGSLSEVYGIAGKLRSEGHAGTITHVYTAEINAKVSNGVANWRFQRHQGLLLVPVRTDVAALRFVAVGLLGQLCQLAVKGSGFFEQELVPDLAQRLASGPPLYDL